MSFCGGDTDGSSVSSVSRQTFGPKPPISCDDTDKAAPPSVSPHPDEAHSLPHPRHHITGAAHSPPPAPHDHCFPQRRTIDTVPSTPYPDEASPAPYGCHLPQCHMLPHWFPLSGLTQLGLAIGRCRRLMSFCGGDTDGSSVSSVSRQTFGPKPPISCGDTDKAAPPSVSPHPDEAHSLPHPRHHIPGVARSPHYSVAALHPGHQHQ